MDSQGAKIARQDLKKAGDDISKMASLLTSIESHFNCQNHCVQKDNADKEDERPSACVCTYCDVITAIRARIQHLKKEKENAWQALQNRAKSDITGDETFDKVELQLPLASLAESAEFEAFVQTINKERGVCWEACVALKRDMRLCESQGYEQTEDFINTMKQNFEKVTSSGLAATSLLDEVGMLFEKLAVQKGQMVLKTARPLSMESEAPADQRLASAADIKKDLQIQLPEMQGQMADLAAVMLMQTQMTIMEGRRRDSYNEIMSSQKENRDRQLRQVELKEKLKVKWDIEEKRHQFQESQNQKRAETDHATQIEVLKYQENMKLDRTAAFRRKERIRNDRDMLLCVGLAVVVAAIGSRLLPLHSAVDMLKTIATPPRNVSVPLWIPGLNLDAIWESISAIMFLLSLAPFLFVVLLLSKIREMSAFTQTMLAMIFAVVFLRHVKAILLNSYVLVMIPVLAELAARNLALTYLRSAIGEQKRVPHEVGLAYYFGRCLLAYPLMVALAILLSDLLLCAEQPIVACGETSLTNMMVAVGDFRKLVFHYDYDSKSE
jgi:hypothetical protein